MTTAIDHRVAQALFASTLQPSEHPDLLVLNAAATRTLAQLGCTGCAARVAVEFGDHPDTAAARMRWALDCEAALCVHHLAGAR